MVFEDSLRGNFNKLNKLLNVLSNNLQQGYTINLKIRGYASQLADEKYNVKISSLRIKSLINYITSYSKGVLNQYLSNNKLNKDIATIDFNNRDLNDHRFICATNKIPKNSVFVLEDIDALYISRNKSDENRVSFSCILNFLDGVYSKENLISIITTNHLEKLDKAIIRPMRIDNISNV